MSKRKSKRTVYVFAHWVGMKQASLMGMLYSELVRGIEIFSFEYDKAWLKSGYAQLLDPDLQLYPGLFYQNDKRKSNFGIFLDSAPDRWGRILMRRRESALARLEKRQEQTLFETEYLLGLYDGHRMGALRFKEDLNGPFLNDNKALASPPWTSIRELETISLRLEDDDVVDDPDYLKWLNMLVAPGSSLGGARPKASVVDSNNCLWIAKFPSRSDNMDNGGWEMVAYEMARQSGINMAESQAKRFSSFNHTFLTKRFDRTISGGRIHFASALTMLGYADGQDHQDGASYLDFVEFLVANGANVTVDLHQLWRRIVFNICVSNTDDHLRNHGFILTERGWTLSPAYDINPVETGTGLKLNISENDNTLDLELAMEVHEYFRLTKAGAVQIIQRVKNSVGNWRSLAKKYRISKVEQELKALAFSQAEL
jgi:serine/threonine-protein kinase HipA